MRHALAVVAVLAAVAALGDALPTLAPLRTAAAEQPQPSTAAPIERLLIAVPDANVAPDEPGLVDLAARLRLADPAATVVVLSQAGPIGMAGSFRLTWEPSTGPDTGATLRVETATRVPFAVDLVATPARPDDGGTHVAVAEVLGDEAGVRAWRSGQVSVSSVELRLPAWRLPDPGVDAVMLDGAWWSLVPGSAVRGVGTAPPRARLTTELRRRLARAPVSGMEQLVDASLGDVTGDGVADLAVSFRRPFQRTLLNTDRPRRAWVDAVGRSAHVGLFRPDDLSSIWVAGTLLRPVHRLAACSGGLAVAYSTLRRSRVVAATAWAWQGFGFLPLPELPGTGRPTCIDIDRDGRPDAAIIERG